MKAKKFVICTISLVLALLIIPGIIVIVVDPFFHYHKPINGMAYRIREERYSNPGIAKHFEYDTIITGTSMTRNFRPSTVDSQFGCKTVKLPIPGAQLGDIGDLLKYAYNNHEGSIDRVFMSLDIDRLIEHSDARNDSALPYYLYDDNYINDINYVFNKSVLAHDILGDITETLKGGSGTTLDEYGAYRGDTGREAILRVHKRLEDRYVAEGQAVFSEDDRELVCENLGANYIDIIEAHPETTFYFFVPPYSVMRWDNTMREGEGYRQLDALETAIKLLVGYDNVEIYDFYDKTELITDFDHYYDSIHFDSDLSDQLVSYMRTGEYRVTAENVDAMIQRHKEWFGSYNYDDLYSEGE